MNRFNEHNVDNNYGKVENAPACQKLCRETEGCEWFNLDKNKTCFLNTAKGEESRKELGGATGPGFCNGK